MIGETSARELPSPAGAPLLGHLRMVRRLGMLDTLVESWQACGDAFALRFGPLRAAALLHPEAVDHVLITARHNYVKGKSYDHFRRLVGDGLVTSEGELWRKRRRVLQPAFHRAAVAAYAPRVAAYAADFFEGWARAPEEERDAAGEMACLTLGLLTATLLNADLAEVEQFSSSIPWLMEHINHLATGGLALPAWVPTPANRAFKRHMAITDGVVARTIAGRRGLAGPPHDLLQRLLDARDEDGQPLDEAALRDELYTLFLAGYETTARTLTWAMVALDGHPEIEAALQAEVDAVLGDRLPAAEDLPRMELLGGFVLELLRLYPPAWTLARDVVEEDVVGGLRVPAGSLVLISPFLTHRHPDFWPEPERLDPGRHRPELVEARPRCAYLPFSQGPRACIGNHFALQELSLVLATLLQRLTISLAPGPPIRLVGGALLGWDRPVRVRASPRHT